MKIQVNTTDVARAVEAASNIVNRGTSVPILAFAEISANGESRALVRTTDLEVMYERWIPCDVIEPGTLHAPARRLARHLSRCSESEVAINFDGRSVTVLAGDNESAFTDVVVDGNMPIIGERAVARSTITIPSQQLKRMLERTFVCASEEERRGTALMGVLFGMTTSALTLVATDGYRLAFDKMTVETQTQGLYIVPSIAVKPILSMLRAEGCAESVEISMLEVPGAGSALLRFTCGDTAITTRLVNSHYPDYTNALPTSKACSVTVSRERLLSAIQRTRVFAGDGYRALLFHISADLTLTTQGWDFGHAKECVPAKIEGEATTIAFNADYVAALLAQIDCDQVVLEPAGGPLGMCKIRPAQSTDGHEHFYVLMPLRQ